MENLFFEELDVVENCDAKDVGAVFGVAYVVGVVAYVAIAAT